jgi:hypothetical protein
VSAEVSVTPVAFEPQTVRVADGRVLRSKVAYFPLAHGGVRGSFGRCELGGFYAMTRVGAEGRCAIVQPGRGQPLAMALSGALGLDYGFVTAPVARLGLDTSLDLGPLIPIIGLYLSTSQQVRYIRDPAVVPIDGPTPGSQSEIRPEQRLTIPLALAIPVARVERSGYSSDQTQRFSLLFGASPWYSLHSGGCSRDCTGLSWNAEHGTVFSLGLDIRLSPSCPPCVGLGRASGGGAPWAAVDVF